MKPTRFPTGRYPAGHVLFERGDSASTFYMIESGQVDLDILGAPTRLARLGPGDSFGEQAILAGGVRSTRAVAASDLVCLEITADSLRQMLGNQRSFLSPVFEALLLQLYMQNTLALMAPVPADGPPAATVAI